MFIDASLSKIVATVVLLGGLVEILLQLYLSFADQFLQAISAQIDPLVKNILGCTFGLRFVNIF
jgi:hypothetical protein